MNRNTLRLVCLLFMLVAPLLAYAGKGEIRFVETSVDLRADGSAVVMYEIQWQVNSGEMHGFYFQGNDKLRVAMSKDQSTAMDSDGNRYKLNLRKPDKVCKEVSVVCIRCGFTGM